jgi:hypothetical protein
MFPSHTAALPASHHRPLLLPHLEVPPLPQVLAGLDDCQMVRSGQPTGVLILVVYLFGGEESKAKNSKVAHEYAERREHGEFILVRASGE